MKIPKLKGTLRKPKTAKAREDLAARDFLRRQQINKESTPEDDRIHTEQFTEQYT